MKIKSFLRQSGVLLLALFIFAANAVLASAAGTVPDLTRKGSVTITLRDQKNNTTVTGGELTLYQVAAAVEQDGSYRYEYTNGFETCGVPLDDLNDSELAQKLQASLPAAAVGTTKAVDTQGSVQYNDLAAGLYLVVQTQSSANYESIAPFVLTIPLQQDGVWLYDVDASPKVGTVTPSTPTPTPSTPTTPGTPTPDTPTPTPGSPETPGTPGNPGTPTPTPGTPRLPQTGQLNWPIPVLCVCGMLLLALGWFLEKDEHEQ